MSWSEHMVRAGPYQACIDNKPDPEKHRDHVEPWLSALFQAEHLNVLLGSGLTTAVACAAGASIVDMSPTTFDCDYADTVTQAARESAQRLERKKLNLERPSEVSPTVLSQFNTFPLYRFVNGCDQELVKRLVPDGLGPLLREFPSLPTRRVILFGWAAPAPILVEVQEGTGEHRSHSPDPLSGTCGSPTKSAMSTGRASRKLGKAATRPTLRVRR